MRAGRQDQGQRGQMQRDAVQADTRLAGIGVFLPMGGGIARASAVPTPPVSPRLAQILRHDRVGRPTQPFCPFWLFFWPHLTGQVRMILCHLPVFPGHRPRGRNHRDSLNAARRRFDPRPAPHSRHCAEPCRMTAICVRPAAHGAGALKMGLDAPMGSAQVTCHHFGRPKGSNPCVNPFLRRCWLPLRRLRPVATPPANRRFTGRGPVRPVLLCSTETSSRGLPSGPLATFCTVRKTPVAASRDRSACHDHGRATFALTTRRLPGQPPPWGHAPMRGGFASAPATSHLSTTYSTTRDSTCLTRS
ncbi:hypothetical protein TRIHO_19590 [Tritonibacter horizontis]|uniref:Uncharacterized protein n=1 Tax=Tritonibacter horizontis TaxID=1768241 RepID=A0A132BXQ6_9RHOB|nr:hypothetical protein TRIHO_19590 [Tritonibacter horizontis]